MTAKRTLDYYAHSINKTLDMNEAYRLLAEFAKIERNNQKHEILKSISDTFFPKNPYL